MAVKKPVVLGRGGKPITPELAAQIKTANSAMVKQGAEYLRKQGIVKQKDGSWNKDGKPYMVGGKLVKKAAPAVRPDERTKPMGGATRVVKKADQAKPDVKKETAVTSRSLTAPKATPVAKPIAKPAAKKATAAPAAKPAMNKAPVAKPVAKPVAAKPAAKKTFRV